MTTRARQTKQRLQIERFRLQFGPYAPPKVPRKNLLLCEMRGYLKVSPNWSDGLIPWPRRWRTGSIILCGDLVRAVKMESVEAVCYHWGVCRNVVQNWRHALGVPEFNPGTDQAYITGLPTYAATAWYHNRLPGARPADHPGLTALGL